VRTTLDTIKTWSWYKKMPSLKRDLFNEVFNQSRGVRISKSIVDTKYLELSTLAQGIN